MPAKGKQIQPRGQGKALFVMIYGVCSDMHVSEQPVSRNVCTIQCVKNCQ